MEENMHSKFLEDEDRGIFKEYEKKYIQRIINKVGKFNSRNVQDSKIFNMFFQEFSETNKQASKFHSKLKHELIFYFLKNIFFKYSFRSLQ